MRNFDLEIEIEGFSGPFDLLCSLVENKKFRASDIKITKLVRIYGLYLVKTKQVPADTLAEFFYMASGLLLEKTLSLLPGANFYDENEESQNENNIPNQDKFIESLERYRPYRTAYKLLTEKFLDEQKSFRREIPIQEQSNEKIITEYNNIENGIYLLASTWRKLHENFMTSRAKLIAQNDAFNNADWDGFQNSENDIQQIQNRIQELEIFLHDYDCLSLNEICNSSRNVLVVTILALLEMCRMGKIYIKQDKLFSDVEIFAR